MVLIDMASLVRKDFRLFTIDTEFLFPETYNLMDRIEEKYGIAIEKVYSVFSSEEQDRSHGNALWTRDPDFAAVCEKSSCPPQTRGVERVDHEYPPRSDLGPFQRAPR